MEPDTKSPKGLIVLVIIVVVLVGGYYLLASPGASSTGGGVPASNAVVRNVPKVTSEQLLGKQPLNQSQQSEVEKHKAEILARVRSGKSLSQEEKSAIGNIMLTQAHLYKFNDAERQAIFDALRK